jgi:mono/diheme cytochrome c family protein
MKTKSKTIKPLLFLGILFAAVISQSVQAQTKPWNAPAVSRAVKNPVASSDAALKEGKTLYITNCSPCHGQKGKGDGPASAALIPKPADHTSAALQNESDGSLFWKLSEGRSPMPQYKKIFNETQRWELVSYIRTLSKSK